MSIVDFAIGPDGALYVAESTRVSRFDAGSDRLVPIVTAAPEAGLARGRHAERERARAAIAMHA